MNDFFDINGGAMSFLGKIFDVVILSLLWLLFSLPMFTIGASTTALYYTTVKTLRRERGYYLKEFFRAFKTNFIPATILWIVMVILFYVFQINFFYALQKGGIMGNVLLVVYSVIILFLGVTALYVFPVLSRFQLKLKDILRISAYMGIRHLPTSVVLTIILFVCFFALAVMKAFIVFVPAIGALLYSFLMERILKRYTPETTEEGKDTWYME